jgi:hypothetical protein
MATEPAHIKRLRELTRAEPELKHVENLEKELYASGSDRSTVVLFGSFVETQLRRLLVSRIRNALNSNDRGLLFGNNGVISTFSSKIIVAYVFKIIGKTTRSDLDNIRVLRNEFAHSRIPFGFTTAEVREVCSKLRIVDLPDSSNVPHGYLMRAPDGQFLVATDMSDPKTRFISTCHNISYRMRVATDGPKEGDSVFANDNPVP